MSNDSDPIWFAIRREARQQAEGEPALASFLHAVILNHDTLEDSLSYHLAQRLASPTITALQFRDIIANAMASDPHLGRAARADIQAVYDRDSACQEYSLPFLHFKGFQALQCYRVAHWLWHQQRSSLAYFFQSHIALVFNVDIHPAAVLGQGIMLDHATGIVIGETTVVEDDVSIMQSVTLGGTGKEVGDRHPKVRRGVLISAGAKILGNIEIGANAKVGAGSVVLKNVEPHTTVVGIPATVVGRPASARPALDMDHEFPCG